MKEADNSLSNSNPNIYRSTTTNGTAQSNKNKKERKQKESNEFEYCKVCKLNHNQGRRHNYFPNHIKSLSFFLSRFHSKLSDVRVFLINPTLPSASLNHNLRFWCVFCDCDVLHTNSPFAWGNVINHLASTDHLKSLKSFFWKYGGGIDRLDSFRISEVDVVKWEKNCKLLKKEAITEGSGGPIIGPVNDIHNELNFSNIDNFDNNYVHYNSSFPNSVVPLQNHTNEGYQVPHSELSEVGGLSNDTNLYTFLGTQFNTNPRGSKDLAGFMNSRQFIVLNGRTESCITTGVMKQVLSDEGPTNGEGSSRGLQKHSQIPSLVCDKAKGNVHSGGPPPWLNSTEGKHFDEKMKPGKPSKLNPKRVGAAWAERRKIELEMEKRGEVVPTNFDANWLPNFGSVWQSGSRKKSRKEFEGETDTSHKVESQTGLPFQLQPYVSKRLRREASE